MTEAWEPLKSTSQLDLFLIKITQMLQITIFLSCEPFVNVLKLNVPSNKDSSPFPSIKKETLSEPCIGLCKVVSVWRGLCLSRKVYGRVKMFMGMANGLWAW